MVVSKLTTVSDFIVFLSYLKCFVLNFHDCEIRKLVVTFLYTALFCKGVIGGGVGLGVPNTIMLSVKTSLWSLIKTPVWLYTTSLLYMSIPISFF